MAQRSANEDKYKVRTGVTLDRSEIAAQATDNADLFIGTGALATFMRGRDWSASAVVAPDTWPLFDDDGAVAGLLCVVVEEIDRIISARRLTTLRELAATAAGAMDQDRLLHSIGAVLNQNRRDLPFTLIYVFDEHGERATLAACSGIDAGHEAAPLVIGRGESPWPIQSLLQEGSIVAVDDLPLRFDSLPCGAWELPPREALIVPITQPGSSRAAAFFVAPINPYRRVDSAFRDVAGLIANQIAGSLASARGFAEARKRAEALAAIDRAKTTFFSNVSHEFRAPLTLMLGPLEEVLHANAASGEETRRQVQLAHRNGMRLLRMVNSLLDFSRIEAGRINANYQPTNLGEFSAEIASSFRSTIERAGLKLTIGATDLPQPVYIDRDMWEKVVLNLLSNAFKFTLSGGIGVEVRTTDDGRGARVSVIDSGIGIPEAELPRLFERFHRVEGAQGRSIEGTGIGLALVQELVTLHGLFTQRHRPSRPSRSRRAAHQQAVHIR